MTRRKSTRNKSGPSDQRKGRRSSAGSPSKSFRPKSVRKDNRKVEIIVGSKKSFVTMGMLREIKRLQNFVKAMIPKMPFCRLLREVMQSYGQYMIQSEAIAGVQCAAEMYLTQLFEDGNLCAAHARRVTLMTPDLRLVLRMRSRYDPIDPY